MGNQLIICCPGPAKSESRNDNVGGKSGNLVNTTPQGNTEDGNHMESRFELQQDDPYQGYEKKFINNGACGKVYKYYNFNEVVAVKEIQKGKKWSKLDYNSEMDAFRNIKEHEHIVKFICTWQDAGFYYIAMEFCNGSLAELRTKKSDYTEHDVQIIIKQVAEALASLQQENISHRDIKPGNILVRTWSPMNVALTDFNYAKRGKEGGNQTVLETDLGTSRFKAPEVAWDEFRKKWNKENKKMKTYNYKCDIWSLGVMMYSFLSAHLAFPFEVPIADLEELRQKFGKDRKGFDKEAKNLQKEVLKEESVRFVPRPQWTKVSQEAQDLLEHMLVPYYVQRCDYEYILNSDWLKLDLSASTKLDAGIAASNEMRMEAGMLSFQNN